MQKRYEKEIMKLKRTAKDREFAQKRELDFAHSLDMERELIQREKANIASQAALQAEQFAAHQQRRKQKEHQKNIQFCNNMVIQTVRLACKVADYRRVTDNEYVPYKLMAQWKTLLMAEQPLNVEIHRQVDKETIEVVPVTEIASPAGAQDQNISVLDEKEFEEYLSGKNDWKYETDGCVAFHADSFC